MKQSFRIKLKLFPYKAIWSIIHRSHSYWPEGSSLWLPPPCRSVVNHWSRHFINYKVNIIRKKDHFVLPCFRQICRLTTGSLVKQFVLHGIRPVAGRDHSLAWPASTSKHYWKALANTTYCMQKRNGIVQCIGYWLSNATLTNSCLHPC